MSVKNRILIPLAFLAAALVAGEATAQCARGGGGGGPSSSMGGGGMASPGTPVALNRGISEGFSTVSPQQLFAMRMQQAQLQQMIAMRALQMQRQRRIQSNRQQALLAQRRERAQLTREKRAERIAARIAKDRDAEMLAKQKGPASATKLVALAGREAI